MSPAPTSPVYAQLAARVVAVGGQSTRALEAGFQLCSLPPDAARTPEQLAQLACLPPWTVAIVPGTVAMTRAPDAQSELDAQDHWYRLALRVHDDERGALAAGARALLCFEGLATLAEVWLDGVEILRSDNMYLSHACDVSALLCREGRSEHELLVRFAALAPVLRSKKGRGRWPTRLVSEKHLRSVRTTLLGYLPGCAPPVRTVGPYGGVRLVVQRRLGVEALRASATWNAARGQGELELELNARVLVPHTNGAGARATLVLADGRVRAPLACRLHAAQLSVRGRTSTAALQPWWPHTHGTPALHDARIELQLGGETLAIELGRVGFRALALDAATARPDEPSFGLRVNGEPLFCRGASWTPLDVRALRASETDYRHALELLRDAGVNMLRLPGITSYESETFHRLCDELGILVWQDLMLASFDYPFEDAAFAASVALEVEQLGERLAARPSLAMLCGGSEVAQQAAMMGLPHDVVRQPAYEQTLRALCARVAPDVPYVPNSPYAEPLPFHLHGGPSHYYGVGAYLRPLDDARSSRVPFASECLAFANPPEPETLRAWLGRSDVARDPRYVERIVRDPGTDWTFGDVTDHYAAQLFGLSRDALEQLAHSDPERYLALGRAAAAEMMERTQAIFRARPHGCRGSLVWLLRDFQEGAGWGVIDARGVPKAPFYALARAWSPQGLAIVDQGLDGLVLYATNDSAQPLHARVELQLLRDDGTRIEHAQAEIDVPARGQRALQADALLGHFADSSYAYRFGPAAHTWVAARMLHGSRVLAQHAFALHGYASALGDGARDAGLVAQATPDGAGGYEVTVQSTRPLAFVAVESELVKTDSYFHVVPGFPHRFALRLRKVRGAHEPGRPVSALGLDVLGMLRPIAAPAPTPILLAPRLAHVDAP